MLKNGWDLLGHTTLKSGVSQNSLMNQADWLNDFCMLIVVE